jgi:hypothetical protein
MDTPLSIDRYRVAAVAYFAYGLVYLGGAILALTPKRMGTFFGFVPWWAFYVVGACLVVALPLLVWRRHKWFTRIIALGPAGKALSLCWRLGADGATTRLYDWFFIAVAIATAVLLFRAGFGSDEKVGRD